MILLLIIIIVFVWFFNKKMKGIIETKQEYNVDEKFIVKNEIGNLAKSDEDVLTYACFPQISKNYLKEKYEMKDLKKTEKQKKSKDEISVQNIEVIF